MSQLPYFLSDFHVFLHRICREIFTLSFDNYGNSGLDFPFNETYTPMMKNQKNLKTCSIKNHS